LHLIATGIVFEMAGNVSYVVNFTGLPLNAIWVANGLSVSLGKRPKPDCLEAAPKWLKRIS